MPVPPSSPHARWVLVGLQLRGHAPRPRLHVKMLPPLPVGHARKGTQGRREASLLTGATPDGALKLGLAGEGGPSGTQLGPTL